MSCCRRRLRDSILPLILDHPSSTALISQQFVIPTCLYGTQVRTSSDPSSPHLALSSAVELMDGFSSHPCLTTAAETGSGRGGVKPRASQWLSGPGQATVFLTAAGDPGATAVEAREETELDLLSVTIEGPSHYSSNSEGSCSVFSSPKTTGGFSPSVPFQSEDGRRDDSLSSTSEDSEKDEKDEDRERERFYIYRKPS